MSDQKIYKRAGFKGVKGDRYWTQNSSAGVKYQCSSCGRVVLGLYNNGVDANNHYSTCEYLKQLMEQPS